MSALIEQRLDNAQISLVVSSNAHSYGLLRARRHGIAVRVLEPKVDWQRLANELDRCGITHIFLVGFMKIIPQTFLQVWQKPILNVHPSLLPEYAGLNSIQRAYADKNAVGVTVHRVIADVDAGEHVLQRVVVDKESVAAMPLARVENLTHWTEYDLVRRSFKVASCWT